MNTRLQVEHPVTEETTGLDLVELQLQVADGGRSIRNPRRSRGYSIEARLYAEDPAQELATAGGHGAPLRRASATEFAPRHERHRLRRAIGSVSIYYDPMLAKVISYAPARHQAAGVLADALARTRIHGVRTNRDLLVSVLRHPAFIEGATDTAFFDTHGLASAGRAAGRRPRRQVVCGRRRTGRRRREPQQRNGLRRRAQRLAQRGIGISDQVLQRPRRRRACGRYRFTRTGVELPDHPGIALVSASPAGAVLNVDGVDRPFDVARYGPDSVDVFVDSPLGPVHLVALPRFGDPAAAVAQGSLLAPMPGSVLRIGAAVGDTVTGGQPLVWLEAMKMEHTVTAPGDGVLAELNVDVGQQVDVGTVLARVEGPGGE